MKPIDTGPGIRREIGAFTATSIVVANIIGAGIFTTSGILAGLLPAAGWVLACWLLGGLIAVAGALCYAELATRMPEEGAEYAYLRRLYHPALGFLTGWTSFIVGFSAPIAASAAGCSEYIFAGIDPRALPLNPAMVALMKKGTAIVIVAAFTALHAIGIRAGSRVQNALTVLKIAIVLGLATAGLALRRGHATVGFAANGTSFDWKAVGTAMMLVMFAYSGWNASAYIAGEVKNARRTLPISLIGGTTLVMALYIAMNLFVFHALPYGEIKDVIPVVERASVAAFGDWMGRALGFLVGIALLSSLSAFIIIGPRVYFAMARDGLFFSSAARVHPRYGVPTRSIVMQGALAVVMLLAGSFEQLLVYLGFALGIFPWLAVAGLFLARKRRIGEPSAAKVPGYPFVPLLFLGVTLGLMVIAYIGRPLESGAAILTVLAGVPCYCLWTRMSGRNTKDPHAAAAAPSRAGDGPQRSGDGP